MGQWFSTINATTLPPRKRESNFGDTAHWRSRPSKLHSRYSSDFERQPSNEISAYRKSRYRPPAQYGATVLKAHPDGPAEIIPDTYVAAPSQYTVLASSTIVNNGFGLSDIELSAEEGPLTHINQVRRGLTKYNRYQKALDNDRVGRRKRTYDNGPLESVHKSGDEHYELSFIGDDGTVLKMQPTHILSSDLWERLIYRTLLIA